MSSQMLYETILQSVNVKTYYKLSVIQSRYMFYNENLKLKI